MKNKKTTGIIVLILIFLLSIGITALNIWSSGFSSTQGPDSSLHIASMKTSKNGYIASLYIEGVIQSANQTYNQEWLLNTISTLKNDRKNKGIAIVMNSPGGTVYEADAVYLALQDYKTTGKPVYVYQANLAASGGYYISCAGNKIYANRNTLTGSIGVITGSALDITDFLADHGIKSRTVTAGKNKNMFNYNEPLTQEQIDIMQSIADECYDQFAGIVAASRNIPFFEVKKLADGRIYTANQALKNGLIDSISDFDTMIRDMEDNEFDGKKLNVIDYRYVKNQTFRDMLLGTFFENTDLKALDSFVTKSTIQYPAFLYEN